jgi:hypothetical protein
MAVERYASSPTGPRRRRARVDARGVVAGFSTVEAEGLVRAIAEPGRGPASFPLDIN